MNESTERVLQQLREVAGRLWPEMVTYTYYNAMGWVIGCTIIVIVLIAANLLFHRFMLARLKAAKETANHLKYLDEIDYYGPIIAISIVSLVVGLCFTIGAISNVMIMLAPEGATVMRMLGK